ncbi:desulfoferrodoxin [Haliovirga abyssi]|uniref:Desulfoferrodoxin n=1 Tax=Haliovirga abyssi TaxID=2996794 RepID=A0AAU9DRK8_9FUSO|nr:desulfoferrodoxin [Haliovirga abyssi]BDU51223.1 desulfoferrodoxin [Haliovirga abyssi]
MAKKLEVYKCEVCGNIVEVLHGGAGELVCCGKPMVLQEEKMADSSTEKHVPFIEELENGYKVKVGETTAHPMTEEHYIEWIELLIDGKAYREFLNPGDAPEAIFYVEKGKAVSAREYCTLHGLWKG